MSAVAFPHSFVFLNQNQEKISAFALFNTLEHNSIKKAMVPCPDT